MDLNVKTVGLSIDKFRFAVEKDGCGFSEIWFADCRGSDVYISARAAGRTTKISLHALGQCHVKGLFPDGWRVLSSWRRAMAPEDDLVHVLSVDFPTDLIYFWKTLGSLTTKQKVFTISAAPTGHAVEFRFFYSRLSPDALTNQLGQLGFPIGYMALTSGEFLFVLARMIPFDRRRIPKGPQHASGSVSRLKEHGEISNASMIAWTNPKDGHPVWFTNLQGITVRYGGA